MTPGPTTNDAFIDFVHARRVVVGGVLLGLALGCVIAAGYFGYRGLKDAFRPQHDATAPVDPNAPLPELEPRPYQIGLAASLIAALGVGGVGAFFLGKVPHPDPGRRRRGDRVLLLVAGYVFGLANRVCGLFLFYYWFSKLTDWLNGEPGGHKTGWMPVAALLQYLIGAGITFLAAFPARSEERNQPLLRRAVYAINFALSGVLLVVGLVLVNAMVAMKLPANLDTTSSGFYSLTDETAKYLGGLKRPIKAYFITQDLDGDRVQADAVRLLERCRQVNPQRFEVEVLSATVNAARIRDLQQQYKAAELREPGVLLTAGPEGERFELVPLRRMVTSGGRDRSKVVFNGEAQLVGGMMALTEERTTVYYTRGSGELTLERPAEPTAAPLSRPAFRLRDSLTATQCEARPLAIDSFAGDAKVPDDAAMVVVLDPLTALPPATVAALERYMTTPRPGGSKKGKLLVFAAAHNAPASGTLAKTGLEPMLAGLGVDLVDRVVYNQPIAENAPPDAVVVKAGDALLKQRHPIALAAANGIVTYGTRPVRTTPDSRGGQVVVDVVPTRYTWQEKGVIDPPTKALTDLINNRQNAAYLQERRFSNQETPSLGVIATDSEGKPAVAVFGFAEGLSDDGANDDGGRTAAVFKAAVGWLRERPPAPDITPKEYAEYTPRKGVSESMLFWVPVCGTLLAIVALGLGVWVVRRK